MTTRVCSVLLLVVFIGLGPMPEASEAGDHGSRGKVVVLYELNEMARFTAKDHRKAKSGLAGKAPRGTPLCPEGLMAYAEIFFAPLGIKAARQCGVVAFGRSDLDLNGPFPRGTIDGEFAVVVDSVATNVADAAELVIMTGIFKGTIQLVDPDRAIIDIVPPSTFTPKWILDEFPGGLPSPAAFSGKFRLPFRFNDHPFYKSDSGQLIPVRANERALGDPTVRLEVTFD